MFKGVFFKIRLSRNETRIKRISLIMKLKNPYRVPLSHTKHALLYTSTKNLCNFVTLHLCTFEPFNLKYLNPLPKLRWRNSGTSHNEFIKMTAIYKTQIIANF